MEKKRDLTIDILRTIGILLILLAHVNPPGIIFQLRNFDVVLLVMISGALSTNSYRKCNNYLKYLKKRFIRLIIPVWIFLTIFFIILRIFNYKQITYSLEKILDSYMMFNGIGYVWIFRVYLLAAIVMPLLLKLKERLSEKKYYIVLMLSYLGYEVLYYLISVFGYKGIFLENIIYYIIPYGVCLGIGMTIKNMKNKTLVMFSVTLIVIFIIIAGLLFVVNGELITTNEYKYPPRIYFLSYGMGGAILLYYLVERRNIFDIKKRFNIKIISFISSHTMWIYLWHIFYLVTVNEFWSDMFYLLKFILILVLSVITTFIQSKIINKTENKWLKILFDC